MNLEVSSYRVMDISEVSCAYYLYTYIDFSLINKKTKNVLFCTKLHVVVESFKKNDKIAMETFRKHITKFFERGNIIDKKVNINGNETIINMLLKDNSKIKYDYRYFGKDDRDIETFHEAFNNGLCYVKNR